VWKEGDGDGMSVENNDGVEGMFSVVNFVYILDTAGDVERIRTKVTPDHDNLFFRIMTLKCPKSDLYLGQGFFTTFISV